MARSSCSFAPRIPEAEMSLAGLDSHFGSSAIVGTVATLVACRAPQPRHRQERIANRMAENTTRTAKDGTATTTVRERFTAPDWHADGWFLERRHPMDWSRRTELVLPDHDQAKEPRSSQLESTENTEKRAGGLYASRRMRSKAFYERPWCPVRNPRGGGQANRVEYRWPAGQIIKTCRIAPKLEIRAFGSYLIAPPSIHPDGDTYEWAQSERCDWGDLPEAPAEWAALQPGAQHDNVVYLNNKGGDNTVALKRLAGLAKHLAETAEGERHKALYTIARTLGQLAASGHLTRDQIHAQLYDAAQRNGSAAEDGKHNITQTINAGIAKGISDGPDPDHHETGDGNSYTLLPKDVNNAAGVCSWCEKTAEDLWTTPTGGEALCDTCREKHTKRARLVLRAASSIRPEEVEWYYAGRVPLGSLTLLVGPAGLGKTTFACWLAARGSRGELDSPATSVIFATAEDSLAHTLVPRLIAAGADLDRVHFVSIRSDDGLETGLTLPDDTDELQTAVKETGANLIILDPVVGHLSGSIDSHKDHSVRRALAPLARLAEDTGAAILGIGHLNKSPSTDVLTRVGGSIAFGAAARSVLLLGEDHEAVEGSPERLLIHAKSNLGPTSPAHRLKVEARTITTEGREFETSGVTLMREELTATASKMLAGRQEPSRLDKATDFLREVLSNGPMPTSEVTDLAAEEGITLATLKRARTKLGVESKKRGYGTGSVNVLSLPESVKVLQTGSHAGSHAGSSPNNEPAWSNEEEKR